MTKIIVYQERIHTERKVGAISKGIRCPIIREGDNLAEIVVDSILDAAEGKGFEIRDKGVISVTESVVARTQSNYASVDIVAEGMRAELGGKTIGVIFSILSRNRFSICLKGITKGAKKVVLMLDYPGDEVGDSLVSLDQVDETGINPYSDMLDLKRYRELLGENKHPFTGVGYVSYYCQLIEGQDVEARVVFANNPREILNHTRRVLICNIHSHMRTKHILKEAGAKVVCDMDDILNAPVDGSGYNEKYDLLSSNRSTEDTIKLFPRDCMDLMNDIQKKVLDRTGKHVEVVVYGDGAFKDPVRRIWELADPVVSVANTEELEGTPSEVKLKYLTDNDFKDLSGKALKNTVSQRVKEKRFDLVSDTASQGTTPRRLTDLIGSLYDLTSGSGDRGTPVILVWGYFDNYTN